MAKRNKDENPDERRERKEEAGEGRSHPVGIGVGAAGGATTGAAIGSVGGPAGVAIGAAVGGIAGALAGKSVAEALNPKDEDEYWRENFAARPYVTPGTDYSTYQPAYRYGWEATARHQGREFDEIEPDLRRDWEQQHDTGALGWDHAREAVRDAWHRARRGATHGFDSAAENRYWRENYASRPYAERGGSYDSYAPAYRYGATAYQRYAGRDWNDVEPQLREDWEREHGESTWDRFKDAVHDAWLRVSHAGSRSDYGGDTTEEERYWRENYASRPYVERGADYDTYAPAYRYGAAAHRRYLGRDWNDVEPQLRQDWEREHGESTWDRFKDAVHDAWMRVEHAMPGQHRDDRL
jgi:hypothetical protein